MAEFNILANLQYSRIQHNRTDLSGVTPTIFANTGSTSGYTEADALVLNQFASTDILDTELFFNTNDKRIFARLDDTIVELVTSGGTLSDRFTTGATLNGNIISFNRNDTLSAYTIDLSSIIPTSYWTGGTGTNGIVQRNSNSDASGTLAVAEGMNTTASGYASHAEGIQSTAVGSGSHAEGYKNTSNSTYTHTGGQYNIASGTNSFIHSSGSTVYGDDSTILGGKGNVINPNITGSTILGGSFITGTTSDTVYGVNFNASGNIIGGTISATTYSNLPTTGVLTYVFISGASSISSYKQAVPLNSYVAGPLSTSATTVTTTPTILGVFATNIGQPNITVIPSGDINVHYDVEKASGSNNYYTYAEIYKRTSGGTETLLTTSDVSPQSSSNGVLNIDVTALLTSNTLLDLTDRIITKIYAVMLSSSATISLRIDDATNARIELPYAAGSTFDIYTTGATLNSGTLSFTRNDNQSYSVNLTPVINNLWTGGTGSGAVVLSGSNSTASGELSVVEGYQNTASGQYSHAEGYQTTANDQYAHSEGWVTTAGYISHAEGYNTRAFSVAHAEGYGTTASSFGAHAEGRGTYAGAEGAHAEGQYTVAAGAGSHAEGASTYAGVSYAHAEGLSTYAAGQVSHVEGAYNTSIYLAGDYSSVGGQRNLASGNTAFIHSSGSTVMGDYSSILGGKGHRINPGVTGSTILGGSFITGTTNDTVYGVNFNASGNIISGGTNLTSIFEPKVAKNKSFVLSNPVSGDKIPIFTVDKNTTITKVIHQTDSGSTSFNLVQGTNFFNSSTSIIGGTGNTATSAATTVTVFTGGTPTLTSGNTLSYYSTGSTFTSSIIYLSIFYTD